MVARARLAAFALFAALAVIPALAAERFEQGILWRVDGKGAPASHIFGTIHLSDPRVTALPAAVAREFGQARSLTIEAGLDTADFAAMANRMVYADGRSLQDVAGAELFTRAAALSAGLGLPEPMLRMFKPWAVALMLSAPQQDPANVLDYVLARMAAEQGKPVLELESLDEQVSVFDGMAEVEQIALLRQTVSNFERLPQTVGRLIDAYLARDLAAMWRISEESGAGDEKASRIKEVFVQRVIYDRNMRMVARMGGQLAKGGAFIAVGALHLHGDRGVLSLLEQRGFRVTRVY